MQMLRAIMSAVKHLNTRHRPLMVAASGLLCLLIASQTPLVVAQSVSDHDRESIIYETTFYDIVPLGSCGDAADAEGVTLQGKDNIQKAFNFFIGMGLTPVQSAGIVGNLRQESQMNPASHNTAAPKEGPHPSSIFPGETWWGGGIAQWEGGRWNGNNGFLNFIVGKGAFKTPQGDGKNWKVLAYQLNYMKWELNNTEKRALDAMKKTKTVEEATLVFQMEYERPSKPHLENRVKYAKEVLAAFGDDVPNNQAPSGACGGVGITIDGYAFPVAPQTKRSYSTLPCPTSNPNAQTRTYRDTRITTCHHDGTPAFDLMYGGVAGKPVYAITKGKVIKVNYSYTMKGGSGKPCGSIQFQSTNGKESTYYWYGHILPGKGTKKPVTNGAEFDVGDQLGVVATQDYGSKCWGGGPHLHIDRGCIEGGKPQQGGGDSCRDPQFLQDLQKIWEGLPAG